MRDDHRARFGGDSSQAGHNSYLFYSLKVAFANEDIIGNGSIFNSVGRGELARFQVLAPEIVLIEQFQDVAGPIDRQIELLTRSVCTLEATRSMLLTRLLSGKLSVDNLDIRFPPGMAEEIEAERRGERGGFTGSTDGAIASA